MKNFVKSSWANQKSFQSVWTFEFLSSISPKYVYSVYIKKNSSMILFNFENLKSGKYFWLTFKSKMFIERKALHFSFELNCLISISIHVLKWQRTFIEERSILIMRKKRKKICHFFLFKNKNVDEKRKTFR